jgi:hypothetical protein
VPVPAPARERGEPDALGMFDMAFPPTGESTGGPPAAVSARATHGSRAGSCGSGPGGARGDAPPAPEPAAAQADAPADAPGAMNEALAAMDKAFGAGPGSAAGAVPYLPRPALNPDGTLPLARPGEGHRTSVLIDSRDRNYASYPSSSTFVVELPWAFHNVTSAMLLSAEIPQSYYVFNAARGNTSLTVALNGVTKTVTVPDGNYTTTSIATALTSALTTAFGGTWTVSFDDTTLRCSIATPASVNPGSLAVDATGATKDADWGLGYHLGFAKGVLTAGAGSVTGSRVASMNPENYVVLGIAELDSLVVAGTGRRAFAKVPLASDTFQYGFYDRNVSAVQLNPPRARLGRVTVSLRYRDGTLVDLNGGEWSMTVELSYTRTQLT